jgi:glycosyltransferase involved in cell wall biosynthesis
MRYQATIGGSIRRARAIVVPTEHTRAQLLGHYPVDHERVLLAPLALDPGLAERLDRPRRPHDHQVVLCVGTLLPRKNLPVVAAAVSRLREDGADLRLRLVGPVRPAGHADLARMTDLLGEALEVVGAVSELQLAEEYAGADVLAYASLHEGFGLPLLEGMAAGLPVVSSNATCLPEVAGDAALLVDPHDVSGWVDALQRALSGPTELVAAGRRRVGDFSWERTTAVVRDAVALAVG